MFTTKSHYLKYLPSITRSKFSFTQFKSFSSSHKVNSIISIEEAGKLVGNKHVKFFDIKDPKEYTKSHIPGAVNINDVFSYLAMSDEKGKKDLQLHFEEVFQDAGLNKDDHAILYEDALNSRFGASCRGWYLLNLFGHKKVSVLNGGWKKWVGAGLPHDSHKVKHKLGNFESGWDKSYWADKEDVLKVVTSKSNKVKLLDIRDTVEWTGESSSPYGIDFVPRKGRLHGAVHVLWSDLLTTTDGITTFKYNPMSINTIQLI